MEIIETEFLVVDVAAVAEGVILSEGGCKGAGGGEGVAPGIVGVLDYDGAGFVGDGYYVALQVGQVEVVGAVPADGQGCAFGIVGKGQFFGADGQFFQLAAQIYIAVAGGAVGAVGAEAVCVVGIAPGDGAVGHGRKLSAVLPGVAPCAVAEGVAYFVIGNGLTVIGCQQVAPVFVPVGIGHAIDHISQLTSGVGILFPVQNISGVIVYPNMGKATGLSQGDSSVVAFLKVNLEQDQETRTPSPCLRYTNCGFIHTADSCP